MKLKSCFWRWGGPGLPVLLGPIRSGVARSANYTCIWETSEQPLTTKIEERWSFGASGLTNNKHVIRTQPRWARYVGRYRGLQGGPEAHHRLGNRPPRLRKRSPTNSGPWALWPVGTMLWMHCHGCIVVDALPWMHYRGCIAVDVLPWMRCGGQPMAVMLESRRW